MYGLSDTKARTNRDLYHNQNLVSPERQPLPRRISHNDDRYRSPRSPLAALPPNNIQTRQPFQDICPNRLILKTPNDKTKISFRTPTQRASSRNNENLCMAKTEHRIEFKSGSTNKGSQIRYGFQTSNFQFTKKPAKCPRTKSQLAIELALTGKENIHVVERPGRVTEPCEVQSFFSNIQPPTEDNHENSLSMQKKYSYEPTTPFSINNQSLQGNILAEKKVENQAKFDVSYQNIPAYIPQKNQFSPSFQSFFPKAQISTNRKQNLTLDQFIKGRRLGKGHFGQVFVVKHKITGFVCALKVISKQHIANQKVTDQIVRELKIHSCLKHPNVIQMYGFFSDQKNLYILQQLCTDGGLWDLLKKRIRISQKYTAYIIKQLVQGLRYLHINSVYHRDIKPENILIQNGIVKICDFGWAVHCMGMRNTRCGTPLYLSPEIVRGEAYDDRVDIWGVGVMTYQLITGSIPFKIYCEEDIRNIITDQVRFPQYLIVGEHAKDFILKALNKNPRERVSLVDLIFHPFLKQTHQMQYIKESEQCSAN